MAKDIHIISVDDNPTNLLLIEMLLKDLDVKVKSFSHAPEALEYLETNTADVDIILTDYMMPDMHGIDFIKKIRQKYYDLPIVMITAVSDNSELKLSALEAGATEFLNKPINPAEFKARILNLSNLRQAQLLLRDKTALLENEVKKAVHLIVEREHEALSVLGRAAEYRDLDTSSHINRVAGYSTFILSKTGVKKGDLELMFYASPLHDIGKIGIPDEILLKPSAYTPEEFDIMKKHPIIGYQMLRDAKSSYLRRGAEIALSHHEKFNGRGYPYGLSGNDIPLTGRVVALADVFDALTTARPYKKAWALEKALDLIKTESGEHFDPELIEILFKYLEDVLRIREQQTEAPLNFEQFHKLINI